MRAGTRGRHPQATLATVSERDIDLLILEELYSSRDFRNWWLSRVGLWNPEQHELVGIDHSSANAFGESDLVLRVQDSAGRRCAVLIEDKISEDAQPDQASRYLQRGQLGIDDDQWDSYITVITAPRAYIESSPEARLYHAQIAHEEIALWYERSSRIDPTRVAYKVMLIGRSIARRYAGYAPIEAPEVTALARGYYEIARMDFPELGLNPPRAKGSRAKWMYFPSPGRGLGLIHKLPEGYVDLQVGNQAANLATVRELNMRLLTDGIVLAIAGNSAALRIRVPEIDHTGVSGDQAEAIREGLGAARRLFHLAPYVTVP